MWLKQFACLIVLSFNIYIGVFVQGGFPPHSRVIGWRTCYAVHWVFPPFFYHLTIFHFAPSESSGLNTVTFVIKCTEYHCWHELKQAVVLECFAVKFAHLLGRLWGRRAASQASLAHTSQAALLFPTQAPEPSLASHLFTDSPAAPSLAFGSHTHPRGGQAAVAEVQPALGRRAGGGFHNGAESLGSKLLCGRVEFHTQNIYGERNWKLHQNMQNLHCAAFEVPPESLLNL